MRALILAVVLLRPAGPAAAQAPGDDWDVRLTDAKGQVTVYEAGSDADGLPAEKGTPLQDGDRVVTGPESSAEIALDATSVIALSSNSDFKLESARRSAALFGLDLGTVLAKIQKLAAGQDLSVRTPAAVAAVRGTEFGVEVPADAPDQAHFGVFDEGKVEVKGASGKAEMLSNNQETSVRKGQAPLAAFQLRRFVRHRARVRAFRRRIALLRKGWKALTPEQRRDLRAGQIGKMRERRKKMLEQKLKKAKRKGKKSADAEKEKKKLDERKRLIREGRHRK